MQTEASARKIAARSCIYADELHHAIEECNDILTNANTVHANQLQ